MQNLKSNCFLLKMCAFTLLEICTFLMFQTELFVALEASKITERKVLEEERMLVEEKLQQKIDEHSSSMNENRLVSLTSLRYIMTAAGCASLLILINILILYFHCQINEELSSLKNENTNLKSQVISLKSQVDGKNEQYEEIKTELLDKVLYFITVH